jgi:hypothetical protein
MICKIGMKKLMGIVFIFCLTGLSAQNIGNIGQLPVMNAPQAPNPFPFNRPQNNPYNPNEWSNIQKQNAAIINDSEHLQAEIQRQSAIQSLTANGFPSQSYQDPEGTNCFYQAFEEINTMLKGDQALNLGRVVFLVENAYYGNTLDYADYQKTIKDNVQLCHQKIKEEKLNGNNNMVKNMMLFRFLSDTLKIKAQGTEKMLTHYPIRYNLDDYESKINYDSHFVTKLMQSNFGQCHSMPLYYLVLAEEMGAEAYWSFSPRHSFVKVQDEKGAWYNIELTCRAILSDAHYMNSGYIKAEAIRNRLYLEPMDKTNITAEMLVNLARYYFVKYGMDDFYLQCLNTAEQYLSNPVNALMMESVYEARLVTTLGYLLDAKSPEILKEKSPEAYQHYEKRQALYQKIDDLGYEELPEDLYAIWLQHVAKLKAESEQQKVTLMQTIR